MKEKFGYWESFDCQEQVEEVYNDILLPEAGTGTGEDIMDMPVFSLEALREGARAGSYMMEDVIGDAIEFDEFWDEPYAQERMWKCFDFRKVGGR